MGIFNKLTDVSDGGKKLPWITRKLMTWVSGYNYQKYWRRRSIVIDPHNRTNKLLKMYYLIWIKRVDAKHHCSFGTSYNSGSMFDTPPIYHMDLMELSVDMMPR